MVVEPKLIPCPTTLLECVSVIGPPLANQIGSTFSSSSRIVISPCLSFISTVNTPSNNLLLLSTAVKSLVTSLEKNNRSTIIIRMCSSYIIISIKKTRAYLSIGEKCV